MKRGEKDPLASLAKIVGEINVILFALALGLAGLDAILFVALEASAISAEIMATHATQTRGGERSQGGSAPPMPAHFTFKQETAR
jgi:hypothetical protein